MKRSATEELEKTEKKRPRTKEISDFFVATKEKKGIVLAVVGGRDFKDYELLSKEIDHIAEKNNLLRIVSGGAKGADSLAKRYADENQIPITELIPEWRKHGMSAGKRRNTDIVAEADYVLAFWDSRSRGTHDSIKKSRTLKKRLQIVKY